MLVANLKQGVIYFINRHSPQTFQPGVQKLTKSMLEPKFHLSNSKNKDLLYNCILDKPIGFILQTHEQVVHWSGLRGVNLKINGLGVKQPFLKSIKNWKLWDFFFTKLSGIDSQTNCISTIGVHCQRKFIHGCHTLVKIAIFLLTMKFSLLIKF